MIWGSPAESTSQPHYCWMSDPFLIRAYNRHVANIGRLVGTEGRQSGLKVVKNRRGKDDGDDSAFCCIDPDNIRIPVDIVISRGYQNLNHEGEGEDDDYGGDIYHPDYWRSVGGPYRYQPCNDDEKWLVDQDIKDGFTPEEAKERAAEREKKRRPKVRGHRSQGRAKEPPIKKCQPETETPPEGRLTNYQIGQRRRRERERATKPKPLQQRAPKPPVTVPAPSVTPAQKTAVKREEERQRDQERRLALRKCREMEQTLGRQPCEKPYYLMTTEEKDRYHALLNIQMVIDSDKQKRVDMRRGA